MKKLRTRAVSLFCAIALVLPLLPAPAQAAPDASYRTQHTISSGLTLTQTNSKSASSSRQIFQLDYTPTPGTTPIVAYGSKLYGKSDIKAVTDYVTKQGYTVMAAVNADFFNMNTGLPTGMLINNGRLCVSSGWNSVGFFPDGTAMADTPNLHMTYTRADGTETVLYALNKVRSSAGVHLYSTDYSTTTKTTTAGTNVVLQAQDGAYLALGQPLELTVVSNTKTSSPAVLGQNQFVLTVDDKSGIKALDTLVPGEVITLRAWTDDPRWHEVVYACGAGDILYRNGSVTAAAKNDINPRTVLGVRPDGSFSIIVCDGRQAGLSDGMSLMEAAQYLAGQGCTTVVNLDGGGSSAMVARYPGKKSVPLISSPSGGALRKCANYIVFVNTGDPNLPESRVQVYPSNPLVMAGASVPMTANTFNDDYFPIGTYENCFVVTEGDPSAGVDGNTFWAPSLAGTVKVGASIPGLTSQDSTIDVIDMPTSFTLVKSGTTKALTAISLSPGETIDLDARLTDTLRTVYTYDDLFDFTTTGNVGSFAPGGVFTAGNAQGLEGTITATCRHNPSLTITVPVTVGKAPELLEDFESAPDWSASVVYANLTSASATINSDPENARYGRKSLRLAYQYTPQDDLPQPEAIRFTAGQPLSLSGGAYITLYAKGSGSYSMDFLLSDGSVKSVPLVLSGSAWQFVSVAVPGGAVSIQGFSTDPSKTASGTLYLDELRCHTGPVFNDAVPPQIEVTNYAEGTYEAQVRDNIDLPIKADMLTLQLDGQPLEFSYDAATGYLAAVLPVDDGLVHRVTLLARDNYGNLARSTVQYGENTLSTFGDLSGHWSQTYVEYLAAKGIFSPDEKFNPDAKTTNAMAATLISRYLGVDTSQYNEVQLPYSDVSKIPDWALPHVRALYQMGIMKGTTSGGKSVFLPDSATTRAQVMTIMGRTLDRGYAYGNPDYSDFAKAPGWSQDHIALLTALGIISGYGETGTVNPLGSITRGEIASLFFKLY